MLPVLTFDESGHIDLAVQYVCGLYRLDNKAARGFSHGLLGLLTKVLVIWFVVSYLAGIIFASALNSIKLGGYPLGFWFAHQGSIYIFIALIFWYAKKIGDIDRKFGMQED
ncbi:DUF4212 domain-containing protein [Hydrogenophaga pseudoflava]|uniref:DUF4212 domain-containing protein n=1 Tax=Hydrogenophaga pseudoflava TaxID=47421 RepID=UPI001FB85608|nr:DUF4212 domain-containing protein [Hydrogenophaga pseudoflava]